MTAGLRDGGREFESHQPDHFPQPHHEDVMRFFVTSYDSSGYLQDLAVLGVATGNVRKRPVAAPVCVLSVCMSLTFKVSHVRSGPLALARG